MLHLYNELIYITSNIKHNSVTSIIFSNQVNPYPFFYFNSTIYCVKLGHKIFTLKG